MSRPPAEDRIPFKIHPRVFAALGADLVTNDVVAVIELVKNCYDAFATRVDVAFAQGNGHGRYLDIIDNGVGMDRKTLEESWGVVATPYRTINTLAKKGTATRRFSGAKGLGVICPRLGSKLEMLTKSSAQHAWLVTLDWPNLSREDTLENCFAVCKGYNGPLPFEQTGSGSEYWDSHRTGMWTRYMIFRGEPHKTDLSVFQHKGLCDFPQRTHFRSGVAAN